MASFGVCLYIVQKPVFLRSIYTISSLHSQGYFIEEQQVQKIKGIWNGNVRCNLVRY